MTIKIIELERCAWSGEYQCLARWQGYGSWGYGETPLQAARSAWRATRSQIVTAVANELRTA